VVPGEADSAQAEVGVEVRKGLVQAGVAERTAAGVCGTPVSRPVEAADLVRVAVAELAVADQDLAAVVVGAPVPVDPVVAQDLEEAELAVGAQVSVEEDQEAEEVEAEAVLETVVAGLALAARE
jgi:hypothetical protein